MLASPLPGATATAGEPLQVFAIPASSLDSALLTLARAGGVEIVSTDRGLDRVRTRPLRGRMSVARALAQLLAGTGYRAVAASGGGYRVIAVRIRPAVRSRPPRVDPVPPPPADIVVTASKQRVPLLRYPGSLTLVGGSPRQTNGGTGDISAISRSLPILQSTQLGPGRNKVFIRGIADSSFNGTTQSTASVYLDDVQVHASGPDPGLRLYDMHAVEVMEGPQGTLYGAGAIGGVLRLTSNAPDAGRIAGSVDGGITATRGGAPGHDLSGMINLPLGGDRVALRAVGYAVRDGGYIHDPGRGAIDVNRTDTLGLRMALRADPGDGWRIETSGVGQRIRSRDGQYGERDEGPRARRTVIAEPFADRLLFGRLLIAKDWDDGLHLVSATGVAAYDTHDVFDATPMTSPPSDRPVVYMIDNDKLLLTHEMRLSQSLSGGHSWLTGFTLVSDRSTLSRLLGTPGAEIDIVGVSNVTRAASVFGEGTVAVDRGLSLTLGGRYTTARVDGEPSSTRRPGAFIKGRSTQRYDPTIAMSYRVASSTALFARYQTGFRTGGLAVAQGIGRVANYQADSIRLAEVGVRRLRTGTTGLGLSASASTARWRGIQADLLNRRGQPFTANIGDAQIETVEVALDWVPTPRFAITASALYTYNRVTGPIADQSQQDNRRLPETPPFAGHLEVRYAWDDRTPLAPRIGAAIDHVGRSVLGTGDLLDVSQGNYTTIGASAGLGWRNVALTIGIDNVTDVAANQFSFGNPFGLAARDQITALRPRNVRLGVAMAW